MHVGGSTGSGHLWSQYSQAAWSGWNGYSEYSVWVDSSQVSRMLQLLNWAEEHHVIVQWILIRPCVFRLGVSGLHSLQICWDN